MASDNNVGSRILAAHARHCDNVAAEWAAARAAGAPAAELADLEAQDIAARKMYKQLAADLPGHTPRLSASSSGKGRRPWWRIW
jgi:hypothetical protein